jgi:hypothetical protein
MTRIGKLFTVAMAVACATSVATAQAEDDGVQAFAATKARGLYYTSDIGLFNTSQPVWRHVANELPIEQISFHRDNPSLFQVCISRGDVYKLSADGVEQWTLILTREEASKMVEGEVRINWVEYNTARPGHIYVLVSSGTPGPGVWAIRSVDYGRTWRPVPVDLDPLQYGAGSLAISPVDNVVYATATTGPGAYAKIFASYDDAMSFRLWDELHSERGFNTQVYPHPNLPWVIHYGDVDEIGPAALAPSLYRNRLEIDGDLEAGIMATPYGQETASSMWIKTIDDDDGVVVRGQKLFFTRNDWTSCNEVRLEYAMSAMDGDEDTISPADTAYLFLGRYDLSDGGSMHSVFVTSTFGRVLVPKAGRDPVGGRASIPADSGGIAKGGAVIW